MQWNEFNNWVQSRWNVHLVENKERNFVISALGLAGEAGEVVDRLKKMYRQSATDRPPEDQKAKLVEELGDVLHYLAVIIQMNDTTLEYILNKNVEKLQARDKACGGTYGSRK